MLLGLGLIKNKRLIKLQAWEKEKIVVEQTKKPITGTSLLNDFRKIGLAAGDIVIVHSSLSKLGWITGGQPTVIDALIDCVGRTGTIAIPAFSTGNGDPALWQSPAVPESWWQTIRNETPPFRPAITPTNRIGRIPETFRKYPGVLRSYHPTVSFAAFGKEAEFITENHQLEEPFGDNCPLEKLYQLDAKILLLGIDHGSNTSLHYAEWKANIPNFPLVTRGAAVLENGMRVWKTWSEIDYDSEDFAQLGFDFEKSISYKPGVIGQAESRLISMRKIVDFGILWLQQNRNYC